MKKKNNFKRFIAGLVSSAMVMASFVFPVTTAKADDIINTGTGVSLTIHKYEYTLQGGEASGTGQAIATTDDRFSTPLGGVGFTVYKIADIEQGIESDATVIRYKTESDLVGVGLLNEYLASDVTAETIMENSSIQDELSDRAVGKTKVYGETNSAGEVVFDNATLDGQGLYLVVETNPLPKVTNPVAPFLVSLPTTIEIDGESEWLYDVHAYPKNSTAEGTIIIKKQEKVADETTSTYINNVKFCLQKKVSESEWTTQNDVGTNGVVTITNKDTGVTIADLPHGDYRLIEVSGPILNQNIIESDVYHYFTITTDGKVVINGDTLNAASTNTLTVINDKPTVKKEVLKKGTVNAWSEAADYSTGDIVKYKVTVTIPESIEKLNTFKIKDGFRNGVFVVDDTSFKYTLYTGEGNSKTTTDAVTIPTNKLTVASNGWDLDLISIKGELDTNNITAIEITFDATLTTDAFTASIGNDNTATLEYTNHIYDLTDASNPVDPNPGVEEETTTIMDKAVVFTFGMELTNTFVGGEGGEAASFDLYKTDAGSATTISVGGAEVNVTKIGTYTITGGNTLDLNTSATSDIGFSNGTYYFVETDTAEGYNLLKEPVAIEIQIGYTKTYNSIYSYTTQYDINGNILNPSEEGEMPEDIVVYTDSEGDPIYDVLTSITVENKKGFSFPVTGGRGTIIFTITGLTLMIVAVCIFFTSRKRKTN